MLPLVGESLRHRLARYAIVIAIFAVIGGIFVQREYLADTNAGRAGEQRDGAATSAETADGGSPTPAAPLAIGRPAPDFVLDTRDGSLRLSTLTGRAVIVNFWATWCSPCRIEMPALQAVHDAHADELVVVAVNVTSADARGAAEAFIDEYGFTFPVAFDVSGDVTERYAVLGLPASFFVDAEGILRARTYGPLNDELLAEGLAAAGVSGR